MSEFAALIADLSELYRDEEIAAWLISQQKLLDGHRPISLVAAGKVSRVREVVSQLLDGAYV